MKNIGYFLAALAGVIIGAWLVTAGLPDMASRASSASPATTSALPITDDSGAIVKAVERIGPSVVNIHTRAQVAVPGGSMDDMLRHMFGDPFAPMPQRLVPARGQGSGVIISADGYILTNNHVVAGAQEIRVKLTDRREFSGQVVGSDGLSDLAVIKIKASDLPAATMGDSDAVPLGEWVIAVGNPLGYENTVTVGVLSGRERSLASEVNVFRNLLQTDAAINPGNSGGPLCNLKGEVIGINLAIIPYAQNLGFAIPVNHAREVSRQLKIQGKVSRPFLGIGMGEVNDEMATMLGMPRPRGVIITEVLPGTGAADARLARGDVILAIDDRPVNSPEEAMNSIRKHQAGDNMALRIWRHRTEVRIQVVLGEMPARLNYQPGNP